MSKVASAPQLPAVLPTEPTPIELPEINIPDNLAKSEDVATLSGSVDTLTKTLALVVQGMAELKEVFEKMPKPEDKTQEISEKVG